MRHYTYVHIRPDTGQIFYVGKGSGARAHARGDRNRHWHNVVKKNSGQFLVRIVNWFSTAEEAFMSEIWLIENLKDTEKLVNITPGGDSPPRLYGDANPMKDPNVVEKVASSIRGTKRSELTKQKISKNRKGKALGDKNPMRKVELKNVFSGLKNSMSKYEHREKHYSGNKTKGSKNGMHGRTGELNPAYGKPSAMRGKKNLGIAWAAANKTWQPYWGA